MRFYYQRSIPNVQGINQEHLTSIKCFLKLIKNRRKYEQKVFAAIVSLDGWMDDESYSLQYISEGVCENKELGSCVQVCNVDLSLVGI